MEFDVIELTPVIWKPPGCHTDAKECHTCRHEMQRSEKRSLLFNFELLVEQSTHQIRAFAALGEYSRYWWHHIWEWHSECTSSACPPCLRDSSTNFLLKLFFSRWTAEWLWGFKTDRNRDDSSNRGRVSIFLNHCLPSRCCLTSQVQQIHVIEAEGKRRASSPY